MTIVSTAYVPVRSALNLFHARRFAEDQGVAFTALLTVSWTVAGYSGSDGVTYNRILRRRLQRAVKYRIDSNKWPGGRLRYIEVAEAPEGEFHTHGLYNLPEEEFPWFASVARDRVSKILGHEVPERAVDLTKVETSGSTLKYMLKGISPAYSQHLHTKASPQGIVLGRRVSCSTHLGPTARNAAGWKRKKS